MSTFKTSIKPTNNNGTSIYHMELSQYEIDDILHELQDKKGALTSCSESLNARSGTIFSVGKYRLDLQKCYNSADGIRCSNFQLQMNGVDRKEYFSTTIALVEIVHNYISNKEFNTYKVLEIDELDKLAAAFAIALQKSLVKGKGYQIIAYFE